jgi:polyphosphate glucokinase
MASQNRPATAAQKRTKKPAGVTKTKTKTTPAVQKRSRASLGATVGERRPTARARTSLGPRTLAIDVGGTGLKASVLDVSGKMTTDRLRMPTPRPCTPEVLVQSLTELSRGLLAQGQQWDRISVGFPGLIRHGVVITAPNLGTEGFAGFDLVAALQKALKAPCRAVNDADMQGLAVVEGKGVEFVCTLGTGFGTALFMDGRLQVHLEVAHLPFRRGETYDQQLGDRAMKAVGKRKWRRRVAEALTHMHTLTNFDAIYIGGGNARLLDRRTLPRNATVVDNTAGILGGIRLWEPQYADV